MLPGNRSHCTGAAGQHRPQPSHEVGWRLSVHLHDSKRPLMVVHLPTLTLKEAQLAERSIKRLQVKSLSAAVFLGPSILQRNINWTMCVLLATFITFTAGIVLDAGED